MKPYVVAFSILAACQPDSAPTPEASNGVRAAGGGASWAGNSTRTATAGGASTGGAAMSVTDGVGSGATTSAVTGGVGSGATTSAVTGGVGSGATTSAVTGGVGSGAVAPLGAFPVASSRRTRGGTMTFTNIGAPGWWPRRINRPVGDPACTYKDGTDTWGGHCCMKEQYTISAANAPFDEELTLILKAIDVKQLAVYQPSPSGIDEWSRVTAWDARTRRSENLWFTQQGFGSTNFLGDLTRNDCVGYVMQEARFDCGDGREYYCPDDPGILHQGFSGSKLVVLLANMTFSDSAVKSCNGTGTGHPGPWIAFVASELVRDGGRKWNGLCNCYSKTGSVGDGCGEINVFEVVMDGNAYSNREFMSTGVRSFQAGHIGGAVAGATLLSTSFPPESEVVDACAKVAYPNGPVLTVGGATDGCPIWRRPDGDRYFFILLDAMARKIQVGILHPDNLPPAITELLPSLPGRVSRTTIDSIVGLRLPD